MVAQKLGRAISPNQSTQPGIDANGLVSARCKAIYIGTIGFLALIPDFDTLKLLFL
jgi:hypothetical protein